MGKDLNENFRDITEENKKKEESKITSFDIVMGLIIGGFFYFGYYVLMTDYFKVEPFKFPYILISIYFVIATISFPYASKRVSSWIGNSSTLDFLLSPIISMPFAYIFAPVFFIIGVFL